MATGKINLQKASGGVASITVADGVGDTSIVLPESGTVATTAYVDGKMVLATAVTASGTAIDFTGIPSWVKRITVMFNGVSTNGASVFLVQIGGSGGIENTGYASGHGYGGAYTAGYNTTTGFGIGSGSATNIFSAIMQIELLVNTTYISSHSGGFSSSAHTLNGGGSKTLSATLDRIRITTVNGTDTFDAGQINIMYEG